MARHAFADHLAGLYVEGGKQRCRAVALVIVRHRLGPPLFDRQAGLRAVESLDLALFINAQHQGPLRRVYVEANNVNNLLGELRVVRELEGVHEMWREAGAGPHPLHAAMAILRALQCVALEAFRLPFFR